MYKRGREIFTGLSPPLLISSIQGSPVRFHTLGRSLLLAFGASVFASSALWASTQQFTQYQRIIQDKLGTWEAHLTPIAVTLLGALFIAECALTYIERGTEGVGLDRIGGELIRKGIMCSAVAWLFFNPDIVIRPLIEGFAGVGGLLNGGTTYTPVAVLDQAWMLGVILEDEYFAGIPLLWASMGGVQGAIWNAITGQLLEKLVMIFVQLLIGGVFIALCELVFTVAFLCAAMQLFLTSMEMVFVIATAPFFSGFASFRVTAGMTDAFLKYVVQVAVKFFLINFMVGTGMVMARDVWGPMLRDDLWLHGTNQGPFGIPIIDVSMLLSLMAMTVAYGYLVWKIPGAFAQKFAGEVRFGIREGAVARAAA